MEQFETPKTLKKRKFPGPAGLLMSTLSDNPPKCARTDGILHGNQSSPVSHNVDSESLPLSQTDHFSSPTWRALLDDLGAEADQVTQRFCIRSMLLKAKRKILPKGKVPLIMGVVESLDMQGMDGSVELRDPSGKMQGSLHRDLFKDSMTLLQVGCVLVLRQVSVISPSPRTHYLNITPWNLVLVYSPPKDGEGRDGVHKYSPRKESESSHKGSFNTSVHRTGSTSFDRHTFSEEPSPLPSLTDIIRDSEKELIASPVPKFVRGISSPQFQPSSPMFGHLSNTNQLAAFKSPLYSNRNNTSSHTNNTSPQMPHLPFSPAGSTTSSYSFNRSPNVTSSSSTTTFSNDNFNSTRNMNSSRQTFPSRVPQTTSLGVSNQSVPSGGSESCFDNDNDDDDLLLLCSVNNHDTDDDDDNHSKHDESVDRVTFPLVNNQNSSNLPGRLQTPESYRDLNKGTDLVLNSNP